MQELIEIEAIKRLKYKYFRCLDSKLWDEMGQVLTDNATAAYDSGKYSYEGKSAILEFFRSALGDREVISKHMGHHPEITLTGSDTAKGVWYFEDYVIFKQAAMRLRGAGFYHDRYVKVAGRWKIEHTGYARTFEEMQTENDGAKWSLTHYGDHLEKV